jgi:hypothetical protein
MSIESLVPLVERIVNGAGVLSNRCSFFSNRHSKEIHALGLKCEFTSDQSRYSQVCVSVLLTTLNSDRIWVRILWSRPQNEYPTEDCFSWEFSLSDEGVRSFEERWPLIRRRMNKAIARCRPPVSIRTVLRDVVNAFRNPTHKNA